MSTKRTYQPKKLKRQKKFGFRSRLSSYKGRLTIKRRRLKKRFKVTS